MKVLFFVLFAGYAVRCDVNNYYVIKMFEDPPQKPFKVYWNVPTMQCKSKKIPFENLYERFGIIQNDNDAFRGEKVTILYDPGLFPALLKNETSGRFKFRNGGVPQEGDLDKHLQAFSSELDQSIPDKDFDGIGIIDFESWRPVYRQNFGVLRPYKDVSVEIERKLHWWWQTKWLEAEAKQRFEESARSFMQSTLALARRLRPNAQWGFYGFPYCFNMASNNMVEACAANVPQENDNISWLWRESTALYPSVYSSVDLSTSQLTSLVRGRVREAARLGRRVLPYFWYRYRDAGFLTEVDLNAALDTLYNSNASGFIIWGSSNDVNTVDKCKKLLNYIEQVMGPAIAKYTQSRRLQDDTDTGNDTISTDDGSRVTLVNKDTTSVGDVATTNNPSETSTNRLNLDPEYHWIPPENYTQSIKDHVEEEIRKKLTNYTGTDKNSVLNKNVLIDMILNSVNVSDSGTTVSNIDSTSKIGTNSNTESEETQSSTITEEIVAISNTESPKLFEDTTTYETYKSTSQIDVTTSTSIDTSDIDTTRAKNIKKSSIQDSMEGFFDVTTDTDIYRTENIEHTAGSSEFTTEYHSYKNKEDYTTEETQSIQTTTGHDVLSTTNGIKTSTETTGYNPSQSTVINDNLNRTTVVPNISTEAPFREINKTEDSKYISTKSPDFIEDMKVTTDLPFEDTSLAPMSTSPDQVSGSAPLITKSQTIYCLIFYIYSVSKCLCSIFGQCS